MDLRIKRIYEPSAADDGLRVLVDRLWPRGLKKEHAAIDLWLREIAPSDALRRWFGHDPEKWDEFRRRYQAELDQNGEAIAILRARGGKGRVTLLYGARDESHNQAVALKEYLDARG
jgi:Uncharacterized conserved protein